ncbi:MAG: hypothetical protein AMXMBFR13_26050 [Phycisphaerae bacterium]
MTRPGAADTFPFESEGLTIRRIAAAQRADWPDGVERIEYASAIDGQTDWALALRPTRGDTWVVHIHGHGSKGDQIFTRPDIRDGWLPVYRRHGFGVLGVNLRGNAWMSPPAAADLHALLKFMRYHYAARRFLLISGSMGGTSNLIYATLHPEDVAAVIALCPASDLATYHQWCRERSEPPVLREIADAIETAYGGPPDRREEAYDAHSALLHAERLTMPVYVVHGSDDAIIPVEQARGLAAAAAGRETFDYLEVPGGDHETPLSLMEPGLKWILQVLGEL